MNNQWTTVCPMAELCQSQGLSGAMERGDRGPATLGKQQRVNGEGVWDVGTVRCYWPAKYAVARSLNGV